MEFTNGITERTKSEIEARLSKIGDYVKMDYLQRALNSRLDFDTKKFVMIRLAGVYEKKGMFSEAARLVKASSDINTTFKSKIDDFMKSAELFVKARDYQGADNVFAQVLVTANGAQKNELKERYINFYFNQAHECLAKDKRNLAKKAYEKALGMELSMEQRKEAQKALLGLYEKLGNIREYYGMKKLIENS